MFVRTLVLLHLVFERAAGLSGELGSIVQRKLSEARELNQQHGNAGESDVARRLSFGASRGNWRFSEAIRREVDADGARRISIMPDIKRRSPHGARGGAAQDIAGFSDAAKVARAMRQWDVDALCVNTDSAYGGKVEELLSVRQEFAKDATKPPVLMKDFIVDPIQIALAAELGADAVVLIAAVLGARLTDLLDMATVLGIEAAVEVHTPDECTFALSQGATLLLVNSRDRATGQLHKGQAAGLRHLIPPNIVSVACGGISTLQDVQIHADAGYDGVMLGRALVGGDPEEARKLVAKTRALRLMPNMWG
ncbi:hypothetical protein M885DRAFT_279531 [Pelagophyceae sp. CCMP2097]|nr:hypothetical protein M885DRAFT_279531 [Pelagophyceae sp. CCMP2097]